MKKAWTEMTGKKEEDIQDIKVYVKTEENKAYYVVNGEAEGHYVELCISYSEWLFGVCERFPKPFLIFEDVRGSECRSWC